MSSLSSLTVANVWRLDTRAWDSKVRWAGDVHLSINRRLSTVWMANDWLAGLSRKQWHEHPRLRIKYSVYFAKVLIAFALNRN